ncbi:hypothetical protein GC173_11440 [bacterium]|nr:hypothetical protein [bacterium]
MRKGALKKRAVKLCAPWKPMSSAPRDGSAVLLLERSRWDGFVCHVASFEFREFKDKRGFYWIGEMTAFTSAERFCGWAPLPKMPPVEPIWQVGDRVRTDKRLPGDPEPVWGVVAMVFLAERRGRDLPRWLYAIKTDAGEELYESEYRLSDVEVGS